MPKGKGKGKGKGKWKPKGKRVVPDKPYQVIQKTHHELLLELQYKYPGLYNLSRKTGHRLLDEIAKIIFERLKNIMGTYVENRDSCFRLSSQYRKIHPHFGDFNMILAQLHALQDASGAPRLQLHEHELKQMPVKPCSVESLPLDQVKQACSKYSEKVLKAINSHISVLDYVVTVRDDDDGVARKKVREEMKKIQPYIPSIVKQIVWKHFTPKDVPYHRIRIYGEPFLPSKEAMSPFVRRYHAGSSPVIRHPRMYNLLQFKIPQNLYAPLLAMDDTVINGAKLVIRSDVPTYEAREELMAEMSAALGGPRDGGVLSFRQHDDYDEDVDMDTEQ